MSKNTGTSELINYFDLGVNGDVGIAGSLDINTIANATTDTDTFLVSDTGIIKYRTGAQLLSDIGAAPAVAGGYVPYTGATTNVDLGVYNLTASAIIANGSGSNSGIVHLESNAIHSLVNGYGSIASGTTNQFNLYQTTGAGVFRGAILSLNSITEFATRTFTLPDTDGTIALTSNIPANPVGGTGTTNYLPKFTGSTTIGNSNLINDASGNLGLGVTPNTWTGTGTKAFQFQNGTLSASNTYGTSLTWNAYFNAGDKYITNGVAGRYLIEGNVHRWDTAPSGTAGNAISFTQAMTLFSTGNLLVGTGSDTGERLQVSGNIKTNSGYIQIVNATNPSLYINNTAVQWQYYLKSNYNLAFSDAVRDVLTLGYNGSPSFFQGGNVGIGTASPVNKLSVLVDGGGADDGIRIGVGSQGDGIKIVQRYLSDRVVATLGQSNYGVVTDSGALRLYDVGGTETVRLSGKNGYPSFITSGNVLIGTTTDAGVKLQVSGGATFSSSVAVNSNVNIVNYTTESSLFVGGAATNGVSNGIILLQSGRIPQSGSDTTGTNGLLFQHTISNATNVNGGYIYNGRETVFGSASVVNTFISFATTLANTNYERIRITSDGILKMSNNSTTFSIGAIGGVQRIQHGTNGFTTEFQFFGAYDGYAPIGASAFNTRSDYRLKEDLKEFSGLSLVTDMKVYDFKWKEQDERNYGFMAHELQEILPYVVTGTKDGMFEGELQMQGVDYSKLVPVLVKAIQELKQEIDTLKS